MGKLDVRMTAIWMGGRTLESARQTRDRLLALPRPPQSLGDARLLSGGVKLYIDGSGGARTAWMYQDWNKDFNDIDKGNVGYPTTDPEVYRAQVKLLHDAGLHVSTHAIGDRAIDWVVDSYAQALKREAHARAAARDHSLQRAYATMPSKPWRRCRSSTTPDIRKRRRHFSGGSATRTPETSDPSARCGWSRSRLT